MATFDNLDARRNHAPTSTTPAKNGYVILNHGGRILIALFLTGASTVNAWCYDPLQPIDENPSYLQSKIQGVIHAIEEGILKHDFYDFRKGYLVSSLFDPNISEQKMRESLGQFIKGKMNCCGSSLPRLSFANPRSVAMNRSSIGTMRRSGSDDGCPTSRPRISA